MQISGSDISESDGFRTVEVRVDRTRLAVTVTPEEWNMLTRMRQLPGRCWLVDTDGWTLQPLGKREFCKRAADVRGRT